MKTNLIENYISSPAYKASQNQKKEKPQFSIEQELNNRTFIKPLRGRGRLSKDRIIDIPANTVKGIAYDAKSLKHGISGNANDHELGKLNDLGMKAGGLAIASYLFTRKQTPLTKAMEFVGLGSFFASMALWPKIALQLPARVIHGVNIGQNYEDSFGRKKPFYQDPQFLPWDLYSDEKMSVLGNRLGVPKNIQNRRDYTQEKMKKVALQNNTMWMLTAGFATPVMSALICNQLEGPILRYQNNYKNKQADKMLANFDKSAKSHYDDKILKNLNTLFELHRDKPVTEKVVDDITKIMTKGMDLITADGVRQDLKTLLLQDRFTMDKTVIKDIVKNISSTLKETNLSEEDIDRILPNEEDYTKLFKNKKMLGNDYSPKEFRKLIAVVMEPIRENLKEYNIKNPEKLIDEDLIINTLVDKKLAKGPISSALNKIRATKLDSTNQSILRNFTNHIMTFNSELRVLDEYALTKVGAAPETVIANYCNEVSGSLIKTLKISSKELAQARFDKDIMGELIRGKFEKVVSNNSDYKRVLTELVNHVAKIDTLIKQSDLNAYDAQVDTVFGNFNKKLLDINMVNTAQRLYGSGNESNTLHGIQKTFVKERLLGVKSSFHRLINTLDLYRRIATLQNIQALHPGMEREVKEEITELCKQITLSGHSADFSTKFYFLRNPNMNMTDFGQIEVADGKVVNKYLTKAAGNTVDIPNDSSFFKESMKLMFENKIHSDTENILSSHTELAKEFNSYREQVLNTIGGFEYFAKPDHLANSAAEVKSSDTRFLLTGMATDELFHKAGQQAYNTKKWLKMFGGLGIGLLGITILSQFFFGKMKYPQPQKVTNND